MTITPIYILIITAVLGLKSIPVMGHVLPDSTSSKLELLSGAEKVKYLSDLSWDLREKNTDLALEYGKYAGISLLSDEILLLGAKM